MKGDRKRRGGILRLKFIMMSESEGLDVHFDCYPA